MIAIDIKEPAKHLFDEYFAWNDLENIDWSNVDAIFHLAGKAHDTKKTAEEKAYFDIIVGLTQKIFDVFLNSNATKFIINKIRTLMTRI
jgi:nucleoside-diphosphate-sugar epimerase